MKISQDLEVGMLEKLSARVVELETACRCGARALRLHDAASPTASELEAVAADRPSVYRKKPVKTDDPLPIQAGDELYAVGPGHHVPHNATDLLVYRAVVRAVRTENYCRPADPPELVIELGEDRPPLGFPKWIYKGYDMGINIHRSPADALSAFAERARHRRNQATQEHDRANAEMQWAITCPLPFGWPKAPVGKEPEIVKDDTESSKIETATDTSKITP